MNNKLFSILLAIVMITSACVIPIASDEGSDAAGKDSGIVLNEPYGIYLDINEDSINQVIGNLMQNYNNKDTEYTESIIFETFFGAISEIMGDPIDIHRISKDKPLYDIDLDAGFSITNTSKTSSGCIYKISAIAKGHAGTNAAITNEATNFIGTMNADDDLSEFIAKNRNSAKNVTVDETMELMMDEIEFGLDMTVETDKNGNITKINGTLGRELSYSGEKETLEEADGYTYLRAAKVAHDSSSYIDFKTDTSGSKPVINATWFLAGDILLLDKAIGPYGNTVIDLDDIEYSISYDKLDAFVTAAKKNVGKNGNVGMADFLNIIDATPIGPMIKGIALSMLEEYELGTMAEAILNNISLGGIYDILYTENGDWSSLNIYEAIGMEEIKEAIIAAKGFVTIDAIPNFIFGKEGIILTEDEADSISKSALSLANKAITGLKDREFDVEFYENKDATTPVTTKEVKFGNAVVKDDLIKQFEEPANKIFVGWFTFNEEGPIAPVSLGRICGDLKVIPVYADKMTSLVDIYNAVAGKNLFAEVTDEVVDITKLTGKNSFITVKDDGVVKSVTWNFPGKDSSVDEVKIKFSSKESGKNLEIDFEHSGDLPEGTVLTIDVGSKFDKGTVLNVYHKESNKMTLVNGMVIVDENGMVKIGLDHCSTYVFEVNDVLTYFDEPENDDDDGGINLILIGGIGLAVIVVGLGVFIYIRKH